MPGHIDRLADMFVRQSELQRRAYGHRFDVEAFTPDTRATYVRDNTLAGIVEFIEALNEIGWKPWATDRSYDTEKVLSELVDAWHFLMNVALASGETPEYLAHRFYEKYVEKCRRNAERQEDGYDGVSTKCPHCARALDDVGIGTGKILGEIVYECLHCHKGIDVDIIKGHPELKRALRAVQIMNAS